VSETNLKRLHGVEICPLGEVANRMTQIILGEKVKKAVEEVKIFERTIHNDIDSDQNSSGGCNISSFQRRGSCTTGSEYTHNLAIGVDLKEKTSVSGSSDRMLVLPVGRYVRTVSLIILDTSGIVGQGDREKERSSSN
jgi:hypothetical protein